MFNWLISKLICSKLSSLMNTGGAQAVKPWIRRVANALQVLDAAIEDDVIEAEELDQLAAAIRG